MLQTQTKHGTTFPETNIAPKSHDHPKGINQLPTTFRWENDISPIPISQVGRI